MAASKQRRRQGSKSAAPGRIDELVEIAARLFVEKGYDATSMQGVADEMGILKGSVYHYVRTKEDLLWMIVEPRLTELVENAREILSDTDEPALERIRRAIEAHAKSFAESYPYMVVITRENGETISAKRRKRFTELRREYHDIWKAAIVEGIKAKELRSDLDVSVILQSIFGMVNWMFRWFDPKGPMSAEEIGHTFGEIVTTGIEAK
jgi:AcrR family transcriptional regulator